MKDVFITFPESYDFSDESVSRFRRRLMEIAPDINPVVLPPGVGIAQAKAPYYVRQKIGDYEVEVGFQTLDEMKATLPEVFGKEFQNEVVAAKEESNRAAAEEIRAAIDKYSPDEPTYQGR